ncbi:MAG: hypothetical protein JWP25_1575 [Bradyrhizobium sp.]|jgi:hypothetical protein|nr:hypothetical protein [Bradyrhizobium sp.]
MSFDLQGTPAAGRPNLAAPIPPADLNRERGGNAQMLDVSRPGSQTFGRYGNSSCHGCGSKHPSASALRANISLRAGLKALTHVFPQLRSWVCEY